MRLTSATFKLWCEKKRKIKYKKGNKNNEKQTQFTDLRKLKK